jgi:hypothetical protein
MKTWFFKFYNDDDFVDKFESDKYLESIKNNKKIINEEITNFIKNNNKECEIITSMENKIKETFDNSFAI